MENSNALRLRRDRIARQWDVGGAGTAVVVASGLAVPVAGTDQFHEFHTHPEFRYLAGAAAAATVLVFDAADGWQMFAPVASIESRVWDGGGTPLEELRAESGIERVRPLGELGRWLESHRGDTLAVLGNHDIVNHSRGYAIESWLALETVADDDLSARLSEQLAESRRAKDGAELERMRAAAESSRFGHFAAMRLARPGMSERALQVEIEAEFYRNGAQRTAYGSIVGSGPNAAILHTAPSQRLLGVGDLVLVDAAAESGGYAADITRTFPVAATFSPQQRELYELVLAVQEDAIANVRPGVEYKDLHLGACGQIAQGLVDLGILRGDAATLVERDAHALFFPHGLGHMLGLSTHDAGGCLAGRTASDRFGLKWLRADLPLEEDYVVTIEPGIYFIPALLDDPQRREGLADAVDWARVDALRGFGGIRIEDDVRVTAAGAEVLSAGIPKRVAAIEELRREALAG
jgi:Xaa-Pro aminopeptidase